MKIKIFSALIIFVVLTLGLAGCERSASTAPVVAPTPTQEFPFPFTTPQGAKDIIGGSATQTAQAQTGGGGPAVTPKPPTTGGDQPAATAVPPTPVPPTAAPVVLPTLDRPATYALKPGEWPICIARRYNLDLGTFFALNGLNMNSKPAAGTSLRLPADGSWNTAYGPRMLAGKSTPDKYTVQAGDTIYTIACNYGPVNPEAIAVLNGLKAPYSLSVGQVLDIP